MTSCAWPPVASIAGAETGRAAGRRRGRRGRFGCWPGGVYGCCSTEDNQDPETSHGWQVSNARKFVEPLGGSVVAEFFDVGQSRSVPWERRDEGSQLLAEL